MNRARVLARALAALVFAAAVALIALAGYFLPTTVTLIIAAFLAFVAYKFTGYAREDESL